MALTILYICMDPGVPVLGCKGASVHVRELTRALVTMGHTLRIVCTTRGEGNDPGGIPLIEVPPDAWVAGLADQMARISLDLSSGSGESERQAASLPHEIRKLAYNLQFGPSLIRLLDKMRPDIVYERFALFSYAGVRAARTRGVPHILEVNAPLIREQQSFRSLSLTALAQAAEQEVLASTAAIVAVSNGVRDYLVERGVAPDRIIVQPNGVDTGKFALEARRQAAALRRSYGLEGKCVVGFVGSLKPWHGVDVLMSAFACARALRPQLHLLIVGNGPMRAALESMARALDIVRDVTFTGALPHAAIPTHLALMDIATAPYRGQEQFYFSPLKVLEYLAMGRAVVASRLGQICEWIEDGTHGLLCREGDSAELAACLIRLADDVSLREALGQAAMRVAARYTWAHVAARVTQLGTALLMDRSLPRAYATGGMGKP